MKKTLMSLVCYLVLSILPLTGFGQKGKLAVCITTSADYYLRKVQENSPFEPKNRLRNSTGINFYYHPTNRLQIKLGASYSNKGFSRVYNRNLSTGIIPDGPWPTEIIEEAKFLDVPLVFGVKIFERGKFTYITGIGLVSSTCFSSGSKVIFYDGMVYEKNDPEPYKDYYFTPVIELSANYRVNEKICLALTPYYRHNLGEIIQESAMWGISSCGLGLDVRYIIN